MIRVNVWLAAATVLLGAYGGVAIGAPPDGLQECNDATNVDRLIVSCTRALTIRDLPNDYRAALLNKRGGAWNRKAEYQRALIDFDTAIRIDRQLASAYSNRAFVWRRLNNLDLALADYAEYIRMRPNDPDGYAGKGEVYRKKHDYINAISNFNEALL